MKIDTSLRIELLYAVKYSPMNDLRKALGDISSIRRQVARTSEFRGYGPATLATTGAFAAIAAAIQARTLPDPANHLSEYLEIWIATAVLAAGLTGAQMFSRARRMHSSLSSEMIRMAVEQFLPAALAGTLITAVIARSAPASAWMLPGLWQLIFSLGIFASCRFLPRCMAAAGAWYLLTGLGCLSLGDSRALSSWTMGIAFAVGQLLVSLVLSFGAKVGGGEV